jgi:hypothetical protein
MAVDQTGGDASETRAWRVWLWTMLASLVAPGLALYCAVLLVDPFSTGRFALTQRIDIAADNPRFGRVGLVRDPQFNGAVFGSSMGFPLDPARMSEGTGWRIAQLAIWATPPLDQLSVAGAFDRYHRERPSLEVFVLDLLWCASGDLRAQSLGPFPTWLYESSDREYLSRIFFPTAALTMIRRIRIWLGAPQLARADGFSFDFADPGARLPPPNIRRPVSGPPPGEPFPALDALETHLASRPAGYPVALVFAPAYARALPEEGSAAAIRLNTCKDRARRLVERRSNSLYLDLMIRNDHTDDATNFYYDLHYRQALARRVVPQIANARKTWRLPPA